MARFSSCCCFARSRRARASFSSISLHIAVISASSCAMARPSSPLFLASMAFSNFCCSMKCTVSSCCCLFRSSRVRSSPLNFCMLEGPRRGSSSPIRVGGAFRRAAGSLRSNSRRDWKLRFCRLKSLHPFSISLLARILSVSTIVSSWLVRSSSRSLARASARSCWRRCWFSAFCASRASRSTPIVRRFASKIRWRRSSSTCRRRATSRANRSSSESRGLALAPKM
mmetsp:Transcript_103306/g.287561  ORF Transcript_103306/g.287561 Transcript_103306/m.287561 type:complete len:226 (+) Transcript_103306:631-1308(+)